METTAMLTGKKSPADRESDAESAVEFLTYLLDAVTAIHKAHLMTAGPGSFAAHEALGEVYSELEDGLDDLAESFMGCQETGLKFDDVDVSKYGAESRKVYEYIERNRDLMGYESHIQNLVDEILDKLARQLFKLDRLA